MRIYLVDFPRTSPEMLRVGMRWISVKTQNQYVYQNYFDETGKYDSYAKKRAIQLLKKQENVI